MKVSGMWPKAKPSHSKLAQVRKRLYLVTISIQHFNAFSSQRQHYARLSQSYHQSIQKAPSIKKLPLSLLATGNVLVKQDLIPPNFHPNLTNSVCQQNGQSQKLTRLSQSNLTQSQKSKAIVIWPKSNLVPRLQTCQKMT